MLPILDLGAPSNSVTVYGQNKTIYLVGKIAHIVNAEVFSYCPDEGKLVKNLEGIQQ